MSFDAAKVRDVTLLTTAQNGEPVCLWVSANMETWRS